MIWLTGWNGGRRSQIQLWKLIKVWDGQHSKVKKSRILSHGVYFTTHFWSAHLSSILHSQNIVVQSMAYPERLSCHSLLHMHIVNKQRHRCRRRTTSQQEPIKKVGLYLILCDWLAAKGPFCDRWTHSV